MDVAQAVSCVAIKSPRSQFASSDLQSKQKSMTKSLRTLVNLKKWPPETCTARTVSSLSSPLYPFVFDRVFRFLAGSASAKRRNCRRVRRVRKKKPQACVCNVWWMQLLPLYFFLQRLRTTLTGPKKTPTSGAKITFSARPTRRTEREGRGLRGVFSSAGKSGVNSSLELESNRSWPTHLVLLHPTSNHCIPWQQPGTSYFTPGNLTQTFELLGHFVCLFGRPSIRILTSDFITDLILESNCVLLLGLACAFLGARGDQAWRANAIALRRD